MCLLAILGHFRPASLLVLFYTGTRYRYLG
jgi:hypothetical protein